MSLLLAIAQLDILLARRRQDPMRVISSEEADALQVVLEDHARMRKIAADNGFTNMLGESRAGADETQTSLPAVKP